MLASPPPGRPPGNATARTVAIVVIAISLLSFLYKCNSRQAVEQVEQDRQEDIERQAAQKVCEGRARQAGLPEECELVDGEWVPVGSE